MKERTRLWLAAGILSSVMLAFFLFMAMPTLGGKEIRLTLEPVDPMDPLRGQYLALSYSINRPSSLPGLPKELRENQAVFVLLQETANSLSMPVQASTTPLQVGKGQTLIQGRFERGRVLYGIEAYFMERGASLETPLRGAVARIKVLSDGRATVAELLKDDKAVAFTYRQRSFWQK